MTIQEELNEYISKLERFVSENSPLWLTPNSHFIGIRPGHNLDLLEISFDFRIDRSTILEAPDLFTDPSKTELRVIK